MTTLIRQNDIFTLNIPKELITDRLVQKLISLVKFRELTQNNAMSEQQATTLAAEIQEKWWADNKDWFLKDIQK